MKKWLRPDLFSQDFKNQVKKFKLFENSIKGCIHLTFKPSDEEGAEGFQPCDGIAFDGLTKSNRRDTLLDGSEAFENYYSVGVGKPWRQGFRNFDNIILNDEF